MNFLITGGYGGSMIIEEAGLSVLDEMGAVAENETVPTDEMGRGAWYFTSPYNNDSADWEYLLQVISSYKHRVR